MKKGAQLNFQFAEDTKAKAAGAKLLQTPRPRPRGQSEAWRAQGALNAMWLIKFGFLKLILGRCFTVLVE
jgi:hypothetical protein